MEDEFAGKISGISYCHITSTEWSIVRAGFLKVISTNLEQFLGQNALFEIQVSVSRIDKGFSLQRI